MALATAGRVGNLLASTVDDLSDIDEDSLDQACTDADAIVLGYLTIADTDDLTSTEVDVATVVATRVAARIYRNPRDLASYDYSDVSQNYSDPRMLTPDERLMLGHVGFPGFA
jgi:hypothetical protein